VSISKLGPQILLSASAKMSFLLIGWLFFTLKYKTTNKVFSALLPDTMKNGKKKQLKYNKHGIS
jgi:hypothetical protein